MRPRLLHFPLPCFPNHLLAVELVPIEPILPPVFQNLVLDASEEGRQAVIVLLRPLVERMVVTLGALQTDAEKHFAKGFGSALRIAQSAIKVGRRVVIGASFGGDQLAGKFIEGLALGNAVPNPMMKGLD